MSVSGSPWPMKPPMAMLMPLPTCDIASLNGMTLFLGTFCSSVARFAAGSAGRENM